MQRRFHERAQFVLIYIAEAHSYDEWPVGDHFLLGRRILQPKSAEERLQLATSFARDYGLSSLLLAVDDPACDSDGGFDSVYAAWPTRFYVLKGGVMSWIAWPDASHKYDAALEELEEFIQAE